MLETIYTQYTNINKTIKGKIRRGNTRCTMNILHKHKFSKEG